MVLRINTDDLDIHPFIRTYISSLERESLLTIGTSGKGNTKFIYFSRKFLYLRYKPYRRKNNRKIVLQFNKYHIHLRCTRSLEAAFAGRKVKRESGANPEQYLLLYIPTPIRSLGLLHSLPLANSWEGVTSGMSQRTYLVQLEDEYLQDTGKNQNCFLIIVFTITGIIYRSAIAVFIFSKCILPRLNMFWVIAVSCPKWHLILT